MHLFYSLLAAQRDLTIIDSSSYAMFFCFPRPVYTYIDLPIFNSEESSVDDARYKTNL
jgi:hypothetical protein